MAAGKLYKDIPRMIRMLNIISQYNNFKQLGIAEDITYLRDKVNKIYTLTKSQEIIDEFTKCSSMINSIYNEIDYDFKKHILEEEMKENEEGSF